MRQGLLIGVGCGLVSALLFFSAAQGGAWLGLLLLLLTPLPAFLAGLGWGYLPAAAGALAGAVAVAAFVAFPLGVGFLVAIGLPATLVAYLAYLSRPAPAQPDGREWYPIGRLLAALSLYAGVLPLLALPWTGGSFDDLRPVAARLIRAVSQSPELGAGRPPTDEQIEALAQSVVTLAPGVMAVYWLLIVTANLYLAGRIACASDHLGRDWPDLPALEYPAGFSLLLGLAVLAALAPGMVGAPAVLGIAGVSFTGALVFAQLLAGLALAHFIARRGARWLPWVVYGGLLLLQPYATVLVAGAGLMEPILKIKQRLGAPPPSS